MDIRIVPYRPEYRVYFEAFNKAWLEAYFVVEPIDEYVLTHPEEAILKDGGTILFAVTSDTVIGTVALKYIGAGVLELTKMAVDSAWKGKGAGKMLCIAAIEKAREMQATTLILYSQSMLKAALGIYHTLGFTPVPLDAKYERADIKMQLAL